MNGFPRFAIIAVCCGLMAAGCELTPAERVSMYRDTLTKTEPLLDQAHQRTVQLRSALDDALAYVQDTNEPIEDRQRIWQTAAKIRDALPSVVAYEQKLQSLVDQTKAQIEALEAAGPVDAVGEHQVIGGAAGGIIAMLPPPWNSLAPLAMPVVMAGGWVLEYLKRRKTTAAVTAIVKGVEAAPADAAETVKASIATKMQAAGVYDISNAIVDGIKKAA
jgi:hypothetical protein